MELSRDVVRKVADLARLKVSEGELDALASDLSDMIGYVQVLNEVDTTDVPPMVHAVELHNVLRSDAVIDSLPRRCRTHLVQTVAIFSYRQSSRPNEARQGQSDYR